MLCNPKWQVDQETAFPVLHQGTKEEGAHKELMAKLVSLTDEVKRADMKQKEMMNQMALMQSLIAEVKSLVEVPPLQRHLLNQRAQ